jgi:hypothetical protein
VIQRSTKKVIYGNTQVNDTKKKQVALINTVVTLSALAVLHVVYHAVHVVAAVIHRSIGLYLRVILLFA